MTKPKITAAVLIGVACIAAGIGAYFAVGNFIPSISFTTLLVLPIFYFILTLTGTAD